MKKTVHLSVVIPCYNEEQRIGKMLTETLDVNPIASRLSFLILGEKETKKGEG